MVRGDFGGGGQAPGGDRLRAACRAAAGTVVLHCGVNGATRAAAAHGDAVAMGEGLRFCSPDVTGSEGLRACKAERRNAGGALRVGVPDGTAAEAAGEQPPLDGGIAGGTFLAGKAM